MKPSAPPEWKGPASHPPARLARAARGLAPKLALLLVSALFALALAEAALRIVAPLHNKRYYVWPPGFSEIFRPLPGATPVAHQSHGLRRGLLPFALTG